MQLIDHGRHGRRQLLQGAGALLAAPWLLGSAHAKTAVSTAKLTIGFAAGGMTDTMARRMADKLTGAYADIVIVDNRAGAGGQIAVQLMKQAPKDGSMLLISPGGTLTIFPHVYRKVNYNVLTDLEPVSLTTVVDSGWAVGPLVPASVTNIPQYLDWCRKNPDGAAFASPGAGTTSHFCGEILSRASGAQLRHTPYRGAQPAIQDMIGGQLPAVCTAVGDFLPYQATGKCRILGTSGPKRTRFTPDVPTFLEQGFKDSVVVEWFGMFAPAGTPPAVIELANKSVVAALAMPDYIEGMAKVGQEAVSSSPAELKRRVEDDLKFWKRIIQETGFKAEV